MQAHSCGESLRLLLCKKKKIFQREILAACFILVALYAQSLKIPFCRDQIFVWKPYLNTSRLNLNVIIIIIIIQAD